MFEPSELIRNRLFQALSELRSVARQGNLTVDVTRIFARDLSGQGYKTIVSELRELGIIRSPSAVPPPGETGWIVFEGDVLRKIPNNEFKQYDRVAVAFVLSIDHKVTVTEATWLNTAAYP